MVTSTPTLVRNVLRAVGVDWTRALFEGLGVPLVEEPLGKLFPVSGRARDVLEALVGACERAGVVTRFGRAVARVAVRDDGAWGGGRRGRRPGRGGDRGALGARHRAPPASAWTWRHASATTSSPPSRRSPRSSGLRARTSRG